MKLGALSVLLVFLSASLAAAREPGPLFNDSHAHLTNYVQEGLTAEQLLSTMGDAVPRATLFGLPLQQKWDDTVSSVSPPTYYLHSDAPLYYYSFVDAMIAEEYLKLSDAQRKRLDPMITGFNPSDRYGVAHIERVLRTYPGVFSGIGEFSVHKEFVSPKIAGHPASLTNPALADILNFAGEVGLLVLLHSDIDVPYPGPDNKPAYFEPMRDLLRTHRATTIVWLHTGLGRVVKPSTQHVQLLGTVLNDPEFAHVYLDISWDEVAKYVTASEKSLTAWSDLITKHSDRFLFGSDSVAAPDLDHLAGCYDAYAALWKRLSPEVREKVLFKNYERLFDAAEKNVRAWEAKNLARKPTHLTDGRRHNR